MSLDPRETLDLVVELAQQQASCSCAICLFVLALARSSAGREVGLVVEPFKPLPLLKQIVDVKMGSLPSGEYLKVKHDGTLTEHATMGGVVYATLSGWSRATVLAGKGPKARAWCVEPGTEEKRVGVSELCVRGSLRVARYTNHARTAREWFRASCVCPSTCDCEAPDNGLCSNLCPEHNTHPKADRECPAREHRNGAHL